MCTCGCQLAISAELAKLAAQQQCCQSELPHDAAQAANAESGQPSPAGTGSNGQSNLLRRIFAKLRVMIIELTPEARAMR